MLQLSLIRVAVLCGTVWVPSLAAAQPASGQPGTPRTQASPAALRRVGQSCVADAQRFCAFPGDAPITPRNAVICLRPYRSSLSLSCRGAVNAVLNPAPPAS